MSHAHYDCLALLCRTTKGHFYSSVSCSCFRSWWHYLTSNLRYVRSFLQYGRKLFWKPSYLLVSTDLSSINTPLFYSKFFSDLNRQYTSIISSVPSSSLPGSAPNANDRQRLIRHSTLTHLSFGLRRYGDVPERLHLIGFYPKIWLMSSIIALVQGSSEILPRFP